MARRRPLDVPVSTIARACLSNVDVYLACISLGYGTCLLLGPMPHTVDRVVVAAPRGLFPRRLARVIDSDGRVSVLASQLRDFASQRDLDTLSGYLAPSEVVRLLVDGGIVGKSTGRCKLGECLAAFV